MSEHLTFSWVEIENFRGFKDRQRIDVDASAVVLSGHNGTGKTSFFDALQWLLIGTLERLEPWRTRRNTEHVANAFADGPAVVSAGIRIGEHIAEVRRQGRHDSGYFEWIDANGVVRGEKAERQLLEAFSPALLDVAGLRSTLLRSGLLQQDVVRVVLEERGFERYEHIAGMLGLDEVAAFERAARKAADNAAASGRDAREALQAADRRHSELKARLVDLQGRLPGATTSSAPLALAADEVLALTPTLRLTKEFPQAPDGAVRMAGRVADIASGLSGLAERLRFLASRDPGPRVSSRSVTAAKGRTSRTRDASERAAQQLALSEDAFKLAIASADSVTAMAATAIPLLTDVCPVCSQAIVVADVRRHLQDLVDHSGKQVNDARLQVEEHRKIAADALRAAQTTDAEGRRLAALEASARDFEAARTEEQNRTRDELSAFVRQLSDLGVEPGDRASVERADLVAILGLRSALHALSNTLGEYAAALRSIPSRPDVATLESQTQAAAKECAIARERARSASAVEERARTLQRAAARASSAVAERRFRLLAPLVRDIYSRLDPHPVFKDLDFALSVYRERSVADPIVRDIETGVEADPLLVFSAAQANVAALAYFIAFGWASGRQAMPFVLLDDPLQSMDDVNSLGFADLCRHIRRQRQLMLSTHDRRLASLLERKLAPRSEADHTIVLEFGPWSRHGPSITRRIVEPQLREGLGRRLVRVA